METKTHNPTQAPSGIEIDLRVIFNAIINNLRKIIIFTILCGIIGLCGSMYLLTPMYRASTSIFITNKLASGSSISSGDVSTSKSLVDSYKVILHTRDTLNDVIEYGNLNRTPGELSGMISAGSVSGTQILRVTVSSADPVEAADIANAIAHVIPKISTTIEGSSVTVVDYAVVPTSPYYPSHSQNALLGLTVGFVISVLVATLVTVLDLTIKDEEDMQHYCSYPLMALVPNMNLAHTEGYYYKRYYHRYSHYAKDKNSNKSDTEPTSTVGKDITFSALEAYKLLRTKLLYSFADGKKCHVIAVSSALSGEGKSITSVNLAYNLAQLHKRVLLIDCDMRRPSVAKKLSLSKYPGLSEYLTGFLSLPELLQVYTDGEEQTPVYVLTAGNTPPNPVELLNSEKMAQAMATLRDEFDYIVLDMPPVCDVSDALSAAKLADGVLLVVRQNYGSHVALRDAIQQFEFVDARIIGCILNCITNKNGKFQKKMYGRRYRYRYGYHYASHYAKQYHYSNEQNKSLNNSVKKKNKK